MPKSHFPPYPRAPHPSGQARIRIDGRQLYLGKHASPESLSRYDELRGEWLRSKSVDRATLTIDELALRFLKHAEAYYVKGGRQTSEVHCIRAALRPLVNLCGNTLAAGLGPLRLKEVRRLMIEAGAKRKTINKNLERIKRMFGWAVSEELVPADVLTALRSVRGLSEGRSEAVEGEPVHPVPIEFVEAVRPHVSRQVWGMVQIQLLTGARPGEIASMRVGEINTAGDVWEYIPRSHKTQHRGGKRSISLGPKAQAIAREFFRPNVEAFLFSPAEAESERSRERRIERRSPLTPSQAARRPKENGKRRPRDHYTVPSYRRAIERACVLAGIPTWHPHQLRHTRATELRRQYGVEAVRAVLGHSNIEATELYAEVDVQRARQIALEVG